MAKAKKLPSGSWRVLVYNGYKNEEGKRRREYLSITAPTEKEANYLALQHQIHHKEISKDSSNMTLKEAIEKYVDSLRHILSPTTVQGYEKIKRNAFPGLMDLPLKKITVQKLNEEINNEVVRPRNNKNSSKKPLAPKTIINEYGLISSVIREYNPKLNLSGVRLPEKQKIIKEILPPEIIFDVVTGTKIELPVLLAMWLSFSMSEIRGLTKSKSISGEYITVRNTVVDISGKAITKEKTKEYDRVRRLKIPVYIKTLIDKSEGDNLVALSGQAIYKRWIRLLDKNNLPHMAFHDLRHVNASVMAEIGVPDKYAQERGGWKTDHTMKRVYQHTFSKAREEVDNNINRYFESKMQHKMQHEEEN